MNAYKGRELVFARKVLNVVTTEDDLVVTVKDFISEDNDAIIKIKPKDKFTPQIGDWMLEHGAKEFSFCTDKFFNDNYTAFNFVYINNHVRG